MESRIISKFNDRLMKYRFHNWVKIGNEIEVEADSKEDARTKAERLVENESTASMETETSGLDLVGEYLSEDGWYVVCGDSCSDSREGVCPVFFRELTAAKACLRRFLENNKIDLSDGDNPARIEIAEDGMSAKFDDGYGRTILYQVGRIGFED